MSSRDDGPMPLIDSPKNPRIQAALELRERSERLATQRTLVDGARESLRSIQAGAIVETAFVCRGLATSLDATAVIDALRTPLVEILEVSERVHDRLAFGNRSDGIVLVVRTPDTGLERLDPGPEPLILVTEAVEKPGNLGAILRTADAAACDAVIAIGGTDLFNPNVIRASVGTVFSMRLATATVAETLAWLTARGIRPVAARVQAALSYIDADLRGPLALIMGNEADGLSDAWQDSRIEGIRLPMRGVADSLNVSVAAAVLAFEARRQRGVVSPDSRSVP
jgi:TrmH family RNA methyltransferase